MSIEMVTRTVQEAKRPYELGRRLDQMDQSRAAILRAAQAQLEAREYRRLTMASLAAASGVTRQTIHNLFGTRAAVLEALFDGIALDGGMEEMREVMSQSSGKAMLVELVRVFCTFWAKHRLLIRRIHGIGAIDPEFGAVMEARNRRRLLAATRVVRMLGVDQRPQQRAAVLAALTSFEFFDGLAESYEDAEEIRETILGLAQGALTTEHTASK